MGVHFEGVFHAVILWDLGSAQPQQIACFSPVNLLLLSAFSPALLI